MDIDETLEQGHQPVMILFCCATRKYAVIQSKYGYHRRNSSRRVVDRWCNFQSLECREMRISCIDSLISQGQE